MITEFTPITALSGGLLIGAAALLLLWGIGRIAGITGISAGLYDQRGLERQWRIFFLIGLAAGAALAAWAMGQMAWDIVTPVLASAKPSWLLIVAGFAVGLGTRLGGGCTSGHGICGMARLSARSIVATSVFMLVAALVVFLIRHLGV